MRLGPRKHQPAHLRSKACALPQFQWLTGLSSVLGCCLAGNTRVSDVCGRPTTSLAAMADTAQPSLSLGPQAGPNQAQQADPRTRTLRPRTGTRLTEDKELFGAASPDAGEKGDNDTRYGSYVARATAHSLVVWIPHWHLLQAADRAESALRAYRHTDSGQGYRHTQNAGVPAVYSCKSLCVLAPSTSQAAGHDRMGHQQVPWRVSTEAVELLDCVCACVP